MPFLMKITIKIGESDCRKSECGAPIAIEDAASQAVCSKAPVADGRISAERSEQYQTGEIGEAETNALHKALIELV